MSQLASLRNVLRAGVLVTALGAISASGAAPAAQADGTLSQTALAAMKARMKYRVGVASVGAAAPTAPVVKAPAPVPPTPVTPAPAGNQVTLPGGRYLTDLPPNFYYPIASAGDIRPLEQQMFDLVNAERAKAGLPALGWDGDMAYVARTRTKQMGEQDYFGHVDPYGFRMWVELIQRWQIPFLKAGENLVANGYAESDTARLAVEGLMNSPTHRANILDPQFTSVGIGVFVKSDGYRYYAQLFKGQ